MRTALLVATAISCAWWANPAEAQQTRTERRVIVVQPQHGGAEDGEVYVSGDDRALNEHDYRRRGRWVEGEWTPDRRRFEGVYEVDEHGLPHGGARHGASYDGPPRGYDGDSYEQGRWSDEDMMRRCRGGGGVTGAAVGGLAGGAIGNRVAGRGNRRVGTAVGAVAGAALGAVIERTADRRACEAWQRDYDARTRYERGYGSGDYYQGGNYGAYDGGYAYGGMQTIVIPGQPVIIEETETTYETVVVPQPRPQVRRRVAPRRVVHRPRPRPRCVCR
jgi:hypothetical protein